MSLFDLTPISVEEIQRPYHGNCVLDRKGRTVRHKPWWELLGQGPAGKTCGDCAFLRAKEYGKTYFKCGRQMQTAGPARTFGRKTRRAGCFGEALGVWINCLRTSVCESFTNPLSKNHT
jgi:hypothetical protein